MIFAGTALRSVVLYGDDADIPLCARRIVDDHHPVGPVNADAVNADTAGQHQAVVGICPHPRGVRGEAEGADRGDESGNCGGATAKRYGRRRWAAARGEEVQAGKEEIIK